MRTTQLLLVLMVAWSAVAAPPPMRRLPPDTTVKRDLPYVKDGHERQKLDLYLPKSEEPLPLVIWVHGGAWKQGSKEFCQAMPLLHEGYAVASINYRLSQHAVFPAQIQDCKAAVRWLRAHAKEYNLDPKRFGAWGSSAGGHLVAMMGVTGDTKQFDVGESLDQSSKVQAVVDYFGPTHLFEMQAHSGPESRMRHDLPNSPESLLIGGPVTKLVKEARAASPITYVTKGDAPMLLVHGDKDPLVPHEQSVLMHEELKKKGVESELVTVKGAGHGQGFGPSEFEKVKAFFGKHLKGSR